MTSKLISRVQNYHGLSTDEKPDEPSEGSTFHAVDTGEQYVFFDGSWEPDLRMIYAVRQAGL